MELLIEYHTVERFLKLIFERKRHLIKKTFIRPKEEQVDTGVDIFRVFENLNYKVIYESIDTSLNAMLDFPPNMQP